ncbi:MAG: valine--tRNA ligase [Candidatus Babeliales bacterium]
MIDKQYDHKQAQTDAQLFWEQEGTYKAENNPGKLYSIDTPPPTVSGSLHIGHIFSYTQTDIIARYKRMHGFSVFYPLGFDDNGLATERYVEKKLDVRAQTMARSQFIALCLQETHHAEEQFKSLWQRMGLSVDWSLSYSTISDTTRAISQESFIELYKKGYVYRKQEPALYCTTCRTSVAQAELEDVEKPSTFNDIVFQDEQGNDLIIGTTRPELLSSCVALIYNPNDSRYQHLKGTQAIVPIFGYKVPIFEDEAVSIDKGTGLVMCCTFGDKTDIEWYKKFKLPYKQSIGLDGKWVADTGILAGLNATQAREKILEALRAQNLLLTQRPIIHAVNVHERCKKEIEYIELSQWFLKILPYKQKFLDLADQVTWYPAFMKTRYKNWVENISWDWGLSRQRFYGIPFPVWHCISCKEIILADVSQLPIDPQETAYPDKCPQCGSTDIKPDTDVMDTWNTSSLTPYICYKYFNPQVSSVFTDPGITTFLPMSMRPQAHDIIRTWAFYTIVKSWMHHNTIPWNNIVISGHVLSDAKQKLSKSQGNAQLTPEKLLEQYPADAIRYWTASGSLGHDVAFSEAQLKIGIRLITKLWNAFKFTAEHTVNINPSVKPTHFGEVNQWLLDAASNTFTTYERYFVQHEFGLALQTVEQFFWKDFCDNYLELIKHQLFNPQEYSEQEVHATRWTLYTVGLRILQLYAPYTPYITETIYKQMYKIVGIPSIHQTKFIEVQTGFSFPESAQNIATCIEIISQVRRLKTEKQLSLKTPLTTLTIVINDREVADAVTTQTTLIKGITQAQELVYTQDENAQSSIEQVGENWKAQVVFQAGTHDSYKK